MNPPSGHRGIRQQAPPPPPPLAPETELLFCAICQVSIAVAELENGAALRTPRGRTFCAVCAVLTPDERSRRRADLETEFADDAPVRVPSRVGRPAARPAVAPVVRRAEDPEPAPIPQPAPLPPSDLVLQHRVGELERSAFRLQARVASLEEKLEALLRRPG